MKRRAARFVKSSYVRYSSVHDMFDELGMVIIGDHTEEVYSRVGLITAL